MRSKISFKSLVVFIAFVLSCQSATHKKGAEVGASSEMTMAEVTDAASQGRIDDAFKSIVPDVIRATGQSMGLIHDGDHYTLDACELRNFLSQMKSWLQLQHSLGCVLKALKGKDLTGVEAIGLTRGAAYQLLSVKLVQDQGRLLWELCQDSKSLAQFYFDINDSQGMLVESFVREAAGSGIEPLRALWQWDQQRPGTQLWVEATWNHAKGKQQGIFAKAQTQTGALDFFSASYVGFDDLGRESKWQMASLYDSAHNLGILRSFNAIFASAGRNYIDKHGWAIDEAELNKDHRLRPNSSLDPKNDWLVRFANDQHVAAYPVISHCSLPSLDATTINLDIEQCYDHYQDLQPISCVNEMFQGPLRDDQFDAQAAQADYRSLAFPF